MSNNKKLYDIPNINRYKITKNGDVYSLKSKSFLREIDTGRGYKHFILYNDKQRKYYLKHYLLCATFKPITGYENCTVDHIDGNPKNNDLSNLEFVTLKENINRYHTYQKSSKHIDQLKFII